MRHHHPIEHSFDWKGFQFFCGLTASLAIVGTGLYYGIRAIGADQPPAPPPPAALTLAPQTPAPEPPEHQIPLRTIRTLEIADVVPTKGKLIAADLVNMKLSLYEDAVRIAEYPIKTKGRPGTPWETPAGMYKIQSKEENHFSSIGKVYMPYSMQFYGNYFIHGWTYYPDGTPTPFTFSGGCIKLDTDIAEKVFRFADIGTRIFVYDAKHSQIPPSLLLGAAKPPPVKAASWLVADLDTGDVFAEHNARHAQNPEYANMLLSALVANETISIDTKIPVPESALPNPSAARTFYKIFSMNDLFYPLLLQKNNTILDALAAYHGQKNFVRAMNGVATALDMTSTTFTGPDHTENSTTAEDLYRLAWYLANKKSFVLKIAATQKKSIEAADGTTYQIIRADTPTTISVLPLPIAKQTRHIAIIVLNSPDPEQDNKSLSAWITRAAASTNQTACTSCAQPNYRKIEL